ncbi:MAG: hypothetical protein R8K49_01645 [Mariprofundaceae bacterium]
MVLKSWVEMMRLAKVRAVIHKVKNSYYLSAEDGKNITLVTNSKNETRHWAKIDTLIKQLHGAGYSGDVSINITSQSEMF